MQFHYKFRAPIYSSEVTDFFDFLAKRIKTFNTNIENADDLLDEVLQDLELEEELAPGGSVEIENRNSFQETV